MMEKRKNIFITIMILVFIFGAKYIKPYEDDIKEYGVVGMVLIIICFYAFSVLIESLIHKIFMYLKKNK
jgi:hypothetical protein